MAQQLHILSRKFNKGENTTYYDNIEFDT